MTYIEFFDKIAAENICAALVNPPERVILVGSDKAQLKSHADRYKKLFLDRGKNVEFDYRTVNRNNLDSIVSALEDLVSKYGECAFDLTGGDELYLVAVGIISERYKQLNINMHRFNISYGTIIDCDNDGKTVMEDGELEMSVEENIKIYGGDVVYSDVKKNGTYIWDMNEDFKKDILFMWNICKGDARLWNTQINAFSVTESIGSSTASPLTVSAPISRIRDEFKRKKKGDFVQIKGIINTLVKAGLITEYIHDDKFFSVTFKNEQVKKCLTKSGQVLEMYIYMLSLDVKDKQGKNVYNDVVNGVYIDWDGYIHTERNSIDTENEIDIMLMHGIVPVFISCKNGEIDTNELYKLSTVAESFGGKYAKKVLIATSLDNPKSNNDEYFRQRAIDMGIDLVENIHKMDVPQLQGIIRKLWK